ncbi:hypothetical protein QJS10_CPB18g00731 [Acorus calamus]|uniref:Bifunctional inhibitor/plant lipid transfer protein/seed storage helical domain-containing protein n=1 Tax=Acorus calamus TaxID=4465 RepID=A0AAV9CIW0_ACOCL|nr:hypothetical protein QJS10_CPB18g00731 [Acorus calamus]
MATFVGSQSICNINMDELVSCRPFVTKGTTVKKPVSKLCCSGMAKADWGCLCQLKKNNMLSPYNVDFSLCEKLPSLCSLTTPSQC